MESIQHWNRQQQPTQWAELLSSEAPVEEPTIINHRIEWKCFCHGTATRTYMFTLQHVHKDNSMYVHKILYWSMKNNLDEKEDKHWLTITLYVL